MKKLLIFVAIVVLASSFTSCASKRKGCGLTADNQSIPAQQEVIVADSNQ